MNINPKTEQEQINDLLRKHYEENIWQIFLSEDDLSLVSDNPIFREVAADLISLERARPSYIPKKFYKDTVWRIHISQEHILSLDVTIEANKLIKNGVMNKICYLRNLISDDAAIEAFYKVNGSKNDLLIHISCLFEKLAEWPYEYKTSGKQDAKVARELRKNLSKCGNLLIDSVNIRFNLQRHWESHIRKIVDHGYGNKLTAKGTEVKKTARKLLFTASMAEKIELVKQGLIEDSNSTQLSHHIDFLNTLNVLIEYLAAIEPHAEKKTSYVKKIHAVDAPVHYAARGLKELFEKYSVPKRQHIKYINDLINAVMKENTTEDRIRKLVS